MKKTLCLLVCFAMLFGMIPNIVSALPDNPEAAEISAPVIEREAEKPAAPAKTETKQGKGVTGVEAGKITLSRKECMQRVFHKSAEEIAAEENAAEVAAWLKENEKRNANVGSIAGAFDKLGL